MGEMANPLFGQLRDEQQEKLLEQDSQEEENKNQEENQVAEPREETKQEFNPDGTPVVSKEKTDEIEAANADFNKDQVEGKLPEGEIPVSELPSQDPKQDFTHGVHGGPGDPDATARYQAWYDQRWTPNMLAAGDDVEGYKKFLASKGVHNF
jgi:hypothetical protein